MSLSRRLLSSLREALMANCGMLAVVDKRKQTLRLVDSFGIEKAAARKEPPVSILGDLISHTALLSREEALALFTGEKERETMKEYFSAVCASWVLPLVHHEDMLGILTLGEKVLPTRFHSEDRQLMETLGSQLSVALKNSLLYKETLGKRLMEEELLFARKIQSAFLPRVFPVLDRLDLYGKNVPSRFVGGDYFDVIDAGNDRYLIAIADVAGKGVPAALLTSMLQASLRTQIMEAKPVKQVITTLNSLIVEMTGPEQFATLFLGEIDTRKMNLTYCNAGHCYPILTGGRDGPRLLSDGDLVLGVLKDSPYEEHVVGLAPGELLVLYTDGVTEAISTMGEEFGEERLMKLLNCVPSSCSAKDVVTKVEKAVVEFTRSGELSDDMTVLALRVLG